MRKLRPKARVWSVDDNFEWMLKSIRFCNDQGVHTDGFLTLAHAKDLIKVGTADFVLHDLGNRATRMRELCWAYKLLKPNSGTIIIDDMHKEDLRQNVNADIKKRGLTATNVGLDEQGRFAYQVSLGELPTDTSSPSILE